MGRNQSDPQSASQLDRGDSVHACGGGETSNIAETGQTSILVDSEDVDRAGS